LIACPIVNLKSTIVNPKILLIEVGAFKPFPEWQFPAVLDLCFNPLNRGGVIQAEAGGRCVSRDGKVSILLIEAF
jgi:hypothetical protein